MATGKEQKVREVFKTIYKKYDFVNDIISLGQHRRWKKELACKVAENKCESVLDVCCGTGDLTRKLALQNSSAKITGIDFSPEMLMIAHKSIDKDTTGRIRFVEGDAMQLPFDDNSFDCAVISFGLRNVSDYLRVLKEMQRVTNTGGIVYCLESSYPEKFWVRPFFRLYFKHIVPIIGRLTTGHGDEYRWLNLSTELFPTKKELAALFEEAGLVEVSFKTYLLGACACHSGRKLFS